MLLCPVAEIDLERLRENVGEIKKWVGEGRKVMGVVKADGYGHGAVEVSKAVFAGGGEYLGVARVEEGVEIREAGIDMPILVLGKTWGKNLEVARRWGIEVTVGDRDGLEELKRSVEGSGEYLEVQVKVDTGMGRQGFLSREVVEGIKELKKFRGVKMKGIFSHFSVADEDVEYTKEQVRRFEEVLTQLETAGLDVGIRHIANTAGLMEREWGYEMVRAGIGMYGYAPKKDGLGAKLKPILNFKAPVVMVRELEPGWMVGYGNTYEVKKRMRIMVIGAGYGDGIPRELSNKGEVLVGGRRCKIIGRVCMDQFMVEMKEGLGEVKAGDEAVIYGRQGGEEIKLEEVARSINKISYELLCAISKRVRRIYK